MAPPPKQLPKPHEDIKALQLNAFLGDEKGSSVPNNINMAFLKYAPKLMILSIMLSYPCWDQCHWIFQVRM